MDDDKKAMPQLVVGQIVAYQGIVLSVKEFMVDGRVLATNPTMRVTADPDEFEVL
jgi:hypothetical protein